MRRVPLFALGAAALLAAPNAFAQSTDRAATPASVALPASLRAAVAHLADSGRALGIPSEPLYLKAAEGQLKGADEERVLAAVRRLLSELIAARRALGPGSSTGELVAGANAIHARVDPERLRELREIGAGTRARSSLVMPLVVIADLVSRRVTPDVAVASVRSLVGQGAPDQQFALLRSAVERDIADGQTPDLAMRARTDVVLRAQSGGAGPLPRRDETRPPEMP